MKTGGANLEVPVRAALPQGAFFPDRQDYRFVDGRLDQSHHLSVDYVRSLPEDRRSRIRVYAGHYPYFLAEELGEDVATLSILRDPIDRTISLLRVYGRPGGWLGPPPTDWPKRSWPLERIYEDPLVFEPLVHNHQTKVFSMTAHDGVDSSRDFIDVDSARLARAKQAIENLDVLGVTERYADLLADVSERFGWHVPSDSRVHAAPPDDPRPVTDAFRRRIAEDNALDVELHQHATRLVAARHGS